MLQTIYETESCFSSASADSHHQPLELLSGSRGSSTAMPTTGESYLGSKSVCVCVCVCMGLCVWGN